MINWVKRALESRNVSKNHTKHISNYSHPGMFQTPLLPLDMDYLSAEVEMEIKYDTDKRVNEKFVRDKYVMFDGEKYDLKHLNLLHHEEETENIAIRVMGLEVDREQFGLFLFSIQFKVDSSEIIKGELKWEDKEYELLFTKGDRFIPQDLFTFTDGENEYSFEIFF